MNSDETTQFTKLDDASNAWSLFALLAKIPLHPVAIYGLLSLSLYIIFLTLALLSGIFIEVVFSLMHLLQICCSISIFASLLLGRLSAKIFDRALAHSKLYFDIGEKAYRSTYSYIIKHVRSALSLLITVPFAFICITLFTIIGRSLPNNLFPVTSSSVLFIFVAYVEISLFMVYLLGSVGLWCLVVITLGFKRLEKYELKFSALSRSSNLYELPKAVFTGTFLQFIVYSFIAPLMIYIVMQYKESEIVLWIGMVGLGSAYVMLLTLIGSTQYSIHGWLVKAKNSRLDEIADAFTRIQKK